MILKKTLNNFEINIYMLILKYWIDIYGENIDFNSKKQRKNLKKFKLSNKEFNIIEDIHKSLVN
jgi:hypothetical protein